MNPMGDLLVRLQCRWSLIRHRHILAAPSSWYQALLSLWIMCAAALSRALVLLHLKCMHAALWSSLAACRAGADRD